MDDETEIRVLKNSKLAKSNGSNVFDNFEQGSVIVEFISLLILLIIPLFAYFTTVTVKSLSQQKDEEVFREVIQIVRSERTLQAAAYLSQRYLTLRGNEGAIALSCKSGDCPHRGSVVQIKWLRPDHSLIANIEGGNWQ